MPDHLEGYHAIVLAAGSGTRFGGGKLIADYRGSPLVMHAIEAALATRAETVVVVLGADADMVEQVLPTADAERLRIVHCERWRDGLSASLKSGIAALPADCRGVLILLGDMPHIDPILANRVLARLVQGASVVLPHHGRAPAHPVAVSADLFYLFDNLQGDHGARAILQEAEGAVQFEVTDPGSVQDVDTRQDLSDLNIRDRQTLP